MQRFTPYENDETRLYEDITRNINTALTILFSIECLLKIFGFGLRVNFSPVAGYYLAFAVPFLFRPIRLLEDM